MERIGTTNGGGALIAMTADEVDAIQKALELLNQIVAVEPGQDAPCTEETVEETPSVPAHPSRPIRSKAPRKKAGARKAAAKPAAKPAKKRSAATRKPAGSGGKVCTVCGKEKPLSEFYDRTGKCKPCYNANQIALKAKKQGKSVGAPGTKICRMCEERKPLDQFDKHKQSCRECLAEKDRHSKAAADFVKDHPSRPAPFAGGSESQFAGLNRPVGRNGQVQRVGG